ncbi:HNH endonuclease [Pendulispora brunnea]|uniref:HNH endonuclease n=1 Tax=Pendulispora brunnea TaxID=2905690 RepID=A0ABZ2JUK7_9BACT
MSTRTLMLTPWMTPHRVISWRRAVALFFLGKVEVLEEYDEPIAAPSITIRTPAVVRLTKGTVSKKYKVRFSRVNVFTRDGFRCQYCGVRKAMDALNYDHVVPRVRGGKTVWENIVTSCYACNDRKGGRLPEEAGMMLLRKPFKPSSLPFVPVLDTGREVPSMWRNYYPLAAAEHRADVA